MTASGTAAAALDRPAVPSSGLRPDSRRQVTATVAALVLLCLAVMAGVLAGPAGLRPAAVLAEFADRLPGVALESGLTQAQQAILWDIRLPRVLLGALVGGTLAISGAAYQGVFRNPLADPYLLGVSSGAGLGATLAIVAGGQVGALALPVAAFAGGLAGVALTYAVGVSVGQGRSATVIILAGVAVGAFANAVQTFVQQRQDDGTVRSVYSWLLGQLVTVGWDDVVRTLPYAALSIAVILAHRRLLDVLAVGDTEAGSLGVDPRRVRLVLVLAATLGTAAVVSVSGLIGFVGIVVPHAVRLLLGTAHRILLPVSLLAGAAFLVLADVLARTALSPAEIPIGVVTAFIGGPFFLLVLRRSRGTGG